MRNFEDLNLLMVSVAEGFTALSKEVPKPESMAMVQWFGEETVVAQPELN